MSDTNKHLKIKSWDEGDRPREKMMQKGRTSLSDAELLAILIGTGGSDVTAVDLGKQLLAQANNDLNRLGKMEISDFCKIKNIGMAKAVTIAAALELGRRRKGAEGKEQTKITSSTHVNQIFAPILADLPYEEFWILLLNKNNIITDKIKLSQGGVGATVIDVKLIVKLAVDRLSSSVIAVHNHPSGSLTPGSEDRIVTEKIKAALGFFDIQLHDHIIVSDTGYFSFADEGLI